MAEMKPRTTRGSTALTPAGKTKAQGRATKRAPAPGKEPLTPRSERKTARAAGPKTKSGITLTSQLEAELAAEAEAGYDVDKLVPRRVGRPSLSKEGGTSHRLSVRVDDQTFQMIQKVAELTNRRPSELVREVLQAAYPVSRA